MKSSLASAVDQMLAGQSVSWPMLAQNLKGLREGQTRAEQVFGRDFWVRHIPHRIRSTTAPVDQASVAARRCFLCPESLYPEQSGVPFGDEFMIYCNPFPILEKHITIVHREHRPQRIAGQFDAFLRVAAELPGSFVLYNGPACGASAPDHLHFQACSREVFPVGRDTVTADYIPRVFVLQGQERGALSARFDRLLATLADVVSASDEPMVNLVAWHSGGAWTVLVFPRGTHRPSVFLTGELTVSPASIDLCGVLVVPVPADFAKIDGPAIERILTEVTLPERRFREVLSRLGESA